jgi:retron-type reverse transcriptase
MEEIVSRVNMMAAYRRVMANKGAAGIDRMTVEQLQPYLKEHWPRIKEELLEGRYRPQLVRGVEIPKPGGGMRQLGIPTVVDRLIQQAMHQVLMPLFDPGFSKASYGFRPGRSAHDAVRAARAHVAEPHFHDDSYGYRPNKSALDAVGRARQRCWRQPNVFKDEVAIRSCGARAPPRPSSPSV